MNDFEAWKVNKFKLRTQKDCEELIERMKRDRSFRQRDSGLNDSNIEKTNPIFEYCKAWFSDNKEDSLDALDLRGFDFMHQCLIGLFMEVGVALATIVYDRGRDAQMLFHQNVVSFSLQRVKEFNMTLFREQKDTSIEISTHLLGLLRSGNLFYGREYQELFPFYGILFVGVIPEFDDEFATHLMALVSWTSALQSKYWPVNANGDWWEKLRIFGVQAYAGLYRSLTNANNGIASPNLDVNARKCKLHGLFCHDLLKIMKRGAGCGSQGLEAQFGIASKVATNGKDYGKQILRKMGDLRICQTYLSSDSVEAKAVAGVIDQTDTRNWTSGAIKIVNKDPRYSAVRDYLDNRFFEDEEVVVKEIRFVKWMQLEEVVEEGGAERGGVKIYASPDWYHKEAFDVIEYGEFGGKYLHLSALCEVTVALDNELFIVRLAIGRKLQVVVGAPASISLRKPLLRLIEDHQRQKLVVIDIDEDNSNVEAAQVVKFLRPERLHHVDQRVFYGPKNKWPKFSAADQVFHHNIYGTYGRLRAQNFMRVFPINSKDFE